MATGRRLSRWWGRSRRRRRLGRWGGRDGHRCRRWPGGRRRYGLADHREPHDRALGRAAQAYLFSVDDGDEGGLLAVDEGAVAAAEVLDDPAVVGHVDLGVPARHQPVFDEQVADGLAADHDGMVGSHDRTRVTTGHLKDSGLLRRCRLLAAHGHHHAGAVQTFSGWPRRVSGSRTGGRNCVRTS